MEKVAVVGSGHGADLEQVGKFLTWLYEAHPDTIVISGGDNRPGAVDRFAEQTWAAFGGQVWSFRVKQLGLESYGTELWILVPGGGGVQFLHGHPTAANRRSALLYRDALVAEACDRLVAFYRPGKSRGTMMTVGFARNGYGKEVHEIERERDESQS